MHEELGKNQVDLTGIRKKEILIRILTGERSFAKNVGDEQTIRSFNQNIQERQSTFSPHFQINCNDGWRELRRVWKFVDSLIDLKMENALST